MKRLLIIFLILISTQTFAVTESNITSFEIAKDVKLEMVKCPTGSVNIGSDKAEVGYSTNSDLKKANLSINKEFYIGKFEITQKQYSALMGNNPSKNIGENNPVERVTYYNAVEFCQKLNQITEKQRPSGYEFRLPTESQWEYACRANSSSSLNNGKSLSQTQGKCEELDEIAWYKYNSEIKTHSVGEKKPNAWGIYDMHGNVAEWCYDSFSKNEATNIVNNESKCLIRGGAYFYEPFKLRSASRGANSPNAISSGFGFRVALVNNNNEYEISEAKPLNLPAETPKEIVKTQSDNVNTDINKANIIQSTTSTNTNTAISAVEPEVKAGTKISVSINGVKFPLIACPKGELTMGSPDNEIGHDKNEQIHKVSIDKLFYIGKYEVTQGQYKAIMGNNPSIHTGDKIPVHNINWLDANNFCKKLNELTKDKRPEGYEFALPTESQWEYACRSGYNTSLNNGKNLSNLESSDNELNKIGWYNANSCDKAQTVGKKIANAWGIHDMLGNIWEFCSDTVKIEDNLSINYHVIRGGGYKSKSKNCRCASRNIIKENFTNEELGFRVILRRIDK